MALTRRRRQPIVVSSNNIKCWSCGHDYDNESHIRCPDCGAIDSDNPIYHQQDDFDTQVQPEELTEEQEFNDTNDYDDVDDPRDDEDSFDDEHDEVDDDDIF